MHDKYIGKYAARDTLAEYGNKLVRGKTVYKGIAIPERPKITFDAEYLIDFIQVQTAEK